jgi:tetratricopeptide (TPR) repeat protein
LASKTHKRAAREKAAAAQRQAAQQGARTASTGARVAIVESPRAGLLIALGVTFVVYARCFGAEFVYDDFDLLVNNPLITQWSFIWQSFGHDLWWFRTMGPLPHSPYYRPLQDAWLGLNYQLWGFNPPGWHVVIVAAHLVVVWLVYVLTWRLTQRRWAATAGALLFGLMPVHVEAAAWPVAIPLPASTALVIGAMLMFIDRARAPLKFLAIALGLYAGGLLMHESAIVLPALIAAWVFLIEDAPTEDAAVPIVSRAWDAIVKIVPFVAVTLAYLGLRVAVLGFITRHAVNNTATVRQCLLSIPAALAEYLAILIAPWNVALGHEFRLVNSPADPRFYLPAIGLIALGAAAALMLYRSKRRALYAFLIVWIVVGLAPVLNLTALVPFALIQDRYAYLSSVALCILLADIAASFIAQGGEARSLAYAVTGTVLAVNLLVLWQQLGVWHDEVSLFTQCTKDYPDSNLCHGRLAMALETHGDLAGARQQMERAIAIDPNDTASLFNLGNLDVRAERFAQAADNFSKAAASMKDPPAMFYLRIAQAAEQADQIDRAEAALKRAEADPSISVDVRYLRAQILANQGHYADSARILRALTEQDPARFDLWAGLGSVLDASGDHSGAVAAYAQAVRLNSRNPQLLVMYAQALHSDGQDAAALSAARDALKLAPGSREVQAMVAQLSQASAIGSPKMRK